MVAICLQLALGLWQGVAGNTLETPRGLPPATASGGRRGGPWLVPRCANVASTALGVNSTWACCWSARQGLVALLRHHLHALVHAIELRDGLAVVLADAGLQR